MTPRWAQKLDAQREPDRSPFASAASTRAHVALLGVAAFFGIWTGQAGGDLVVRLKLPVAASLIAAAVMLALIIWAASLLTRRGGYLVFGFSIVFVLALMGSTVLKLLVATRS
jgi:hypothetical protein